MKSVDLLYSLLRETSKDLGVQTHLDIKTIKERIECEGDSFLTITLPSFDSWILTSIKMGKADSASYPVAFKRKRKGGTDECLPCFMYGLTSRIFDPRDGSLRSNVATELRYLRQIVRFFAKTKALPTETKVRRAINAYITTDTEVRNTISASRSNKEDRRAYKRIANLLFGKLFAELGCKIRDSELRPVISSGANQQGMVGLERWSLLETTQRVTRAGFHIDQYFGPSMGSSTMVDMDDLSVLSPHDEANTRLAIVPKTLKTPRIITIEPTYRMFVQQALMREFYDGFERSAHLRRFLPLGDQMINQNLARESSLSGKLATLDLSEASDRVSILHVCDLLGTKTDLFRLVMACRSTRVDIPGVGPKVLAKYASMGSALTFPLEAMVFLTIIFVGIERSLGYRLNHRTLRGYIGSVTAYGDDLVVPVEHARSVIDCLEAFGLKVNVAKSFYEGNFRESCGGDFLAGMPVKPVYLRQNVSNNPKNASAFMSTVALQNQLFEAGFLETAKKLGNFLLSGTYVPVVDRECEFMHVRSLDPGRLKTRFCRHTQKLQVRSFVARSKKRKFPLQGRGAWMKAVHQPSVDDKDHLTTFSVPYTEKLVSTYVEYR